MSEDRPVVSVVSMLAPSPDWFVGVAGLDLRDGAKVRLTDGHNIQGAQQPGMMHIGASAPVRMRDGSTRANLPGGVRMKVLQENVEGDITDALVHFPPGYVEP